MGDVSRITVVPFGSLTHGRYFLNLRSRVEPDRDRLDISMGRAFDD